MVFRTTRFLFILATALSAFVPSAFSQPATPPAPHVEALTTHDLSSDSVGATPGDFRVDEGGAASYTLPILSLPGTAGLSPSFHWTTLHAVRLARSALALCCRASRRLRAAKRRLKRVMVWPSIPVSITPTLAMLPFAWTANAFFQ